MSEYSGTSNLNVEGVAVKTKKKQTAQDIIERLFPPDVIANLNRNGHVHRYTDRCRYCEDNK